VDRSFAARPRPPSWIPPIGRLARPLTVALPRRTIAKRLCIALAALALLGGGWLLLRNSPLVSVEHVRVSGVQGVDAGPIDAALQSAARRMSTLNVNVGALRAAVASFPVVRDLSVSTSLPHGLRIHVVEQLPVAALSAGGVRTAVAADGVVLGPGLLASLHVPLPAIALAAGSRALADLRSVGRHVDDATARAELSVLGAAPHVLLGWVDKVLAGREGLTVAMRNGVSIYFGDATRPHAKWLAAARVLADPSSAGATYVDVRAPERPAAGTTAAGGLEGGASTGQVSASDPTSAALATALAEAVGGGHGAASAAASGAGASSATGSSAAASPAGGASAAGGSAAGSGASAPSTTEPSTTEPSTTEPSSANSGRAAGASTGASEPVGASTTESSAAGATTGGG
jgi:cell division protein FtsQ